MPYGFRVRFILAPGRRIDCQDKALTLETTEGHRFQIEAVEGGPVGKTANLSILSRGYDDAESATAVGQRVKDTLLLASAAIHLGADMGREKALCWINPDIIDMMRKEHKVEHLNDIHGLTVFSTNLPICIGFSSGASLTVHMRSDQLQQSFSQNYAFADCVTERQKLAAELINLIHFEHSQRARFLMLITALEVLVKPKEHPPEYQVARCRLRNLAGSVTEDQSILQYLKDGLGMMKRQSLTKACKDMVARCIDDSAASEVPQLYDLRSRIIHRGAGISADEVRKHSTKLLEMVTSTLLADVRRSADVAADL